MFPLLCSMPGHAQYTLGLVTCIDNVVDNARVRYHQMASIFKINDGDAERKRKAEIGLPTLSKPQQKRARVKLFRDSYTAIWPYIVPSECDDYAFCKVCDDSFFHCAWRWNYVSHGHIAELNKLWWWINLLGNFSWLCRRLLIRKQWTSLVQSHDRGTK